MLNSQSRYTLSLVLVHLSLIAILFLRGIFKFFYAFFGSWQAVSFSQLHDNLIQSILYLHIQPPLMAFISGLTLKFSSLLANKFKLPHFALPMTDNIIGSGSILFILYIVMGTFIILGVYNLLKFYLSPKKAYILSLVFAFYPVLLWLECYISYEIYIAFFLVYLILLIHKIYYNYKNIYLIGIASCTSLLIILRATYQWHFFLFIAGLLYFLVKKKREFWLCFFLPVLMILLLLMAKNGFLFKTWDTSTQGPLHLNHSWVSIVKDSKAYNKFSINTRRLLKDGYSILGNSVEYYIKLGYSKPLTNIEVLDSLKNDHSDNKNHISMVQVARSYSQILQEGFKSYSFYSFLMPWAQAYRQFWQPISCEGYEISNLLGNYWNIYAKLIEFNLSISGINFNVKTIFGVLVILTFIYLFYLFFHVAQPVIRRKFLFYSLVLGIFFYSFFTSAFIGISGNTRYRFPLDPLIFSFAIIILVKLVIKPIISNPKKRKLYIAILLGLLLFVSQLPRIFLPKERVFLVTDKDTVLDLKGIQYDPNCLAKYLKNNMTFIKGGEFFLGHNDFWAERFPEKIKLKDFYISQAEISVKQYREFINETKSNYPVWGKGIADCYKEMGQDLTSDDHPIVGISYYNAKAYCQWLSKKTGRVFRLPTEGEWEYVARNLGQYEKYPWPIQKPVNTNGLDSFTFDGYKFTAPVKSLLQNKDLTIYNIAGNVWEWVDTQEDYIYAYVLNFGPIGLISPDCYKDKEAKIFKLSDAQIGVLRGGSFESGINSLSATKRLFLGKDICDRDIGFRVVCQED